MVAVNATLEVDFLGQCASESIGSDYWSSSGGQPDFTRGAMFAEHGQSFIVLHSTTADESVSRIVAQLHPGAAVTTFKTSVARRQRVGVADPRLEIASVRKLISIAPEVRYGLTRQPERWLYYHDGCAGLSHAALSGSLVGTLGSASLSAFLGSWAITLFGGCQ